MVKPSWDYFFYYGENVFDLNSEDEYDILQGVMQSIRSLFYFRQEGAGISDYENYPNAFSLLFLGRYNIVKWIAFRNFYISTNNFNRQIIVSQDSIGLSQQGNMVDVDIGYRNYKTINIYDTMKMRV